MGRRVRIVFCSWLVAALVLCTARPAYATHVYGADLFYTYVSSNTYTISLVVYGDCSAQPNIFNSLYTAAPQVEIYNGNTLIQTINLAVQNPIGVEVTPVCPAQLNNTACTGGTIPGIKRFIYTSTITLSGPSASWRFHYTGNMGGSTSAGRSSTITNIQNPGSSQVSLNATLDNLNTAINSSPVYTTIPTPFFCLNRSANFNPGAVDADVDSLSIALVPAINTNSTQVTYIFPYTATAPLAIAPGSFAFDPVTGQLSFIPNLLQRSLVVYTVYEYRNGVLIGTSQREMTFVVINTCSNAATTGIINSATGAVVVDTTSINVCTQQGPFTFQINPVNATHNNITVSKAGLPAGSVFNIVSNNTPSPQCTFVWNTNGVTPGAYTFFVTYIDDGCPLSSRQVVAYTVNIGAAPSIAYNILNTATCVKRAGVSIAPSIGATKWTMDVYSGATLLHTLSSAVGTVVDSFSPGAYTLHIVNAYGCIKDTNVMIDAPSPVSVTASSTPPKCYSGANGSITINATGTAPFTYTIIGGGLSLSNIFPGLSAGTYLIRTTDINSCIKDTNIVLSQPTPLVIGATAVDATCQALQNGKVTLTATGGVPGYSYSIGTGAFTKAPAFTPLTTGAYIFHVADTNNCVKDTPITIVNKYTVTNAVSITNALCYNQSSGILIAKGAGGTIPYQYSLNTGSYAVADTFKNRAAGTYTVHVKDANNCTYDTVVAIAQPTPIASQVAITPPACFGYNNGKVVITASGGTPVYKYASGAANYSSSNTIQTLGAGVDTISITDANNCLYDTVITITQPTPLVISAVTPTNVQCYHDNTGAVSITATGGTPVYSYALNGAASQLSETFTGLAVGTQIIKVTDINGCSKDTSATLTEPDALVLIADSLIQPTCEGYKDGTIYVHAAGGTQPYTYTNDGVANGALGVFNNLQEGTHTVHVTDAHNCTQAANVPLVGYPHLVFDNIDIYTTRCYGTQDGMITVTGTGGNPPFSYYLDNRMGITNTFTNLPVKTYKLTLTDSMQCRKDTVVSVGQPDVLKTVANTTPNNCVGINDGTITLVVTGGTAPYSYQWDFDTLQRSSVLANLDNGTYAAHILDARLCADSVVANVLYNDCCQPFLPDAFTPNGDGKNDVFRLLYKGDLTLNIFAIYDRAGRRVYYSTDVKKGWDGTYNGTPQDGNVYFYFLKANCGLNGNHEIMLKGDVTLIR